MKRGALLLALIAYVGLANAQQLEDALRLFDEANGLVESGAYAEAIVQYHAVQETGFASGALYHNLASAYFRLDEIGEAVRYYERARRLLGDDPQLLHNIQIVEAYVQSPFSELPTPFWQAWWYTLFGQYSAWRFLVSGMGLYLMACLLYAHGIWSQTHSNWHRRARVGTLGIGLLLLLTAVLVSDERGSIQGAAILESTTLVTETGSIDVPEGVKVSFIEETELGAEVSLPNGVSGYVDASVLGFF
jgi:tetratricopeptide (TPR) repeat protein